MPWDRTGFCEASRLWLWKCDLGSGAWLTKAYGRLSIKQKNLVGLQFRVKGFGFRVKVLVSSDTLSRLPSSCFGHRNLAGWSETN